MGVIDSISFTGDRLTFFGWLFHPRHPISRLQVLVNGSEVHCQPPSLRPDVGRAFPWVNHSHQSGYSVSLNTPVKRGRIDILGEVKGDHRVYWSTFFRDDLDQVLPSPPETLSNRIAGYSGPAFKLRGLKIFTDLYDQIEKHGMLDKSSCLLDWGSGCGSVTVHLREISVKETVAADIDPEAIAWARSAIPGISFDVVRPTPPLPYANGQFDLIVASSVFTHLSRELQREWLEELCRVVAPGGFVLASTHGEFSLRHITATAKSDPWRSRRKKWRLKLEYSLKGISDSWLDGSFDQILPKGYYRTVLQSEAYTKRDWEKFFRIVDYIPRGLAGQQDLVVMRPTRSALPFT